MAQEITIERRRRGFFGWVWLIVFWGYQALFAISMIQAIAAAGATARPGASDAEMAGVGLAVMLFLGLMFWPWLIGTVIFGTLMLLMRGRREFVREMRP